MENIAARCKSTLQNIHLALLVKNKYVQRYGCEVVLRPLVDDLKKLETEGLRLSANGIEHHRVGTDIALCGDNLSSHAVGRFSTCFSSDCICPVCMACKPAMSQNSEESLYVLRIADVHAYHVKVNQQNSAVYGVNAFSVSCSILKLLSVYPRIPWKGSQILLEGVVSTVIRIVLTEL